MEKAMKVLRERGLAVAAKKEGRIAAEGVVDILKDGNVSAMIEVNAETDFVAKNDTFKEFVKGLLRTIIAIKPENADALLAANFDGSDITVDAKLKEMIFTIGEKITIRRFVIREGITSTYIHGAGVAGVIVRFTADEAVANNDEFAAVAKNIALQIAAGSPPTYVCQAEVPANVIEEEKNIQVAALKNDPKNANKPDAILEKIVIGKMGKFYENVCLLDQSFFKEDDMTVGKYLETEGKRLGGEIKVVDFVLYEKGEGLEKREDNFAEEIAKLTGNN
jgi:elongation factor Ts